MNLFLHGGCATACFVIGLFLLRYWRTTRDRLFAFFTAAFWVLALHWIGLGVQNPGDETRHWFYVVRLVGFVLIVAGIVDKNRRNRPP